MIMISSHYHVCTSSTVTKIFVVRQWGGMMGLRWEWRVRQNESHCNSDDKWLLLPCYVTRLLLGAHCGSEHRCYQKKCCVVSKYNKLPLRIWFFPLVFSVRGVSWRLYVRGSFRRQSRDGGLPLCCRHGWKEGPWHQPHNAHTSHRLHSPQDMQVIHISGIFFLSLRTESAHQVLSKVNT